MAMSWKKPPPVVVIGGTETFLRSRELQRAVLVTAREGWEIVWARAESDVTSALTMAGTFGTSVLCVAPVSEVSPETVQEAQARPIARTCLLLVCDGLLDEKKYPVLTLVPGGFQVAHNQPTTRKGLEDLAVRFAVTEAGSLLGNKEALSTKLAEALVTAVGAGDLGVLRFELSKMSAMARHENKTSIELAHVKALVKVSSEIDMEPLREALRMRDATRLARALERIRKNSPQDPVMLLLRAKGGPADLSLRWLQVALLLRNGATPPEIAMRTDTPEWIVTRDLVPGARAWGVRRLRELVGGLSQVDRGVLSGCPSPWIACESALMLGCLN